MSCHWGAPQRLQRSSWFWMPLACVLVLLAPSRPVAGAEHERAAAAGEVSLARLLAHAREHAPAALIAALRRGHAGAAKAGAEPLLGHNPSLQLGIGPRFAGPGQRDFDFVAALSQPIEIAGQRARRRETAARLGERLEAEQAAVVWGVRRELMRVYHRTSVARIELELLASGAEFARQLLEMARRRLTAGDASLIELRLAEVDAAEAEQAALTAEQDLAALRLQLAALAGWSLDDPPLPSRSLEPPRPLPELKRLLALAARHPELAARRAAAAESAAQASLAQREAWPSPAVGVQLAREGAVGSPTNYIVLGTLGLELPLWQRNAQERERSQVDAALARVEADNEAAALRAELTRAHGAALAAERKIALLGARISGPLEESLGLLQRGFDDGELDLATVSDGRERLLAARRAALAAHAEYWIAIADLEFALGMELPAAGAGSGP